MTVTKSTSSGKLTYRIAQEKDRELLLQLRKECGWGDHKIHQFFGKPHRPFCIFSLRRPDNENSQVGEKEEEEVVGMGGWVLDMPDDQETASRKDGVVYLTSLFIRKPYQSLGLGTKAIDILEKAAKDEFGAKIITLDTTAYLTYFDEEGWLLEDFNKRGATIGWYEKRGYVEYRAPHPVFPRASKTDPDRKLWAVFLRKAAA